jgi:hypothetical protein
MVDLSYDVYSFGNDNNKRLKSRKSETSTQNELILAARGDYRQSFSPKGK